MTRDLNVFNTSYIKGSEQIAVEVYCMRETKRLDFWFKTPLPLTYFLFAILLPQLDGK